VETQEGELSGLLATMMNKCVTLQEASAADGKELFTSTLKLSVQVSKLAVPTFNQKQDFSWLSEFFVTMTTSNVWSNHPEEILVLLNEISKTEFGKNLIEDLGGLSLTLRIISKLDSSFFNTLANYLSRLIPSTNRSKNFEKILLDSLLDSPLLFDYQGMLDVSRLLDNLSKDPSLLAALSKESLEKICEYLLRSLTQKPMMGPYSFDFICKTIINLCKHFEICLDFFSSKFSAGFFCLRRDFSPTAFSF